MQIEKSIAIAIKQVVHEFLTVVVPRLTLLQAVTLLKIDHDGGEYFVCWVIEVAIIFVEGVTLILVIAENAGDDDDISRGEDS